MARLACGRLDKLGAIGSGRAWREREAGRAAVTGEWHGRARALDDMLRRKCVIRAGVQVRPSRAQRIIPPQAPAQGFVPQLTAVNQTPSAQRQPLAATNPQRVILPRRSSQS